MSGEPLQPHAADTVTAAGEPSVVPLFGYTIFSRGRAAALAAALAQVERRGPLHHIACANPHSIVVADGDKAFADALRACDLLLPDGTGVALALKLVHGHAIERVTGSDLFRSLIDAASAERPLRFFFLGASDTTLAAIRARLQRENPHVIWAGCYSPPYVERFSDEENRRMVDAVNAARPDVLWVGMTAPKQEKWIHAHRALIDVPVAGAIGAVFDYYAGRSKRPQWAARLGIEWLVRLVQEPRRLWRRTFVSTPLFLLKLARAKFGPGPAR